ncbi:MULTISPECIES: four-helix bundle copper-binding protein [unclassified Anabaena]|uniref:four-helix bundle copper-binding protein n=1 Tax=unclassified Anabaena TaxID=2619674 RepID=UPI0006AC0B52|nr:MULTISPECIES: four-helix bundle copper-binding protein [unclassified Anabaena]ALB42226.1 ferredoxin [Anabaena sp. WA102]OBQ18389.1 MAG: ferredoxin [Anabaena sp. AL93]
MMMMMTKSMTNEMQICVNACMECHKMCLETMTYCMTKGGKYMDITMMIMLRDCAEMCMMCTNMMMAGSEFSDRTCMLCAEMCDRCAITCEKMSDDSKMMECAAACRRCAESCRSMQMMPV